MYKHKDLLALATRNGVGLVFAIPDALVGHTLFTSSRHSTGDITREGVHKHVFRDRKSMLHVFRSLHSHSMRTAQRVAEDDDDTVPMAAVFQEVFTTYEMPITSLQYVLLSKPNTRIEKMVHMRAPHAQVRTHTPRERDLVHSAKLAVHAVKVEGLRYARSQAERALQGLASFTSAEAKALRTQLQALLKKGDTSK